MTMIHIGITILYHDSNKKREGGLYDLFVYLYFGIARWKKGDYNSTFVPKLFLTKL